MLEDEGINVDFHAVGMRRGDSSWTMERYGKLCCFPVTLEKNGAEMIEGGDVGRSTARSTRTTTTTA
eukprot:9945956-Heterocapsa_arctica.AAC.1